MVIQGKNILRGVMEIPKCIVGSVVGLASLLIDIVKNPYEEYSKEWIDREKELRG